MRPDGTDLTLLSIDPSAGEDGYPAWLPNGKTDRIPSIQRQHRIGCAVRDAGRRHARSQDPGTSHCPKASASRGIPPTAATSRSASTRKGSAAFTIRLDGTHTRRVTPWALDGGAYDWSPDGRWLLIESHADGSWQRNVFPVHPNGTDLHAVTHTYTGGEIQLGWSRLLTGRNHDRGGAIPESGKVNPDIWVMRLDGSGLRDAHQFVDL